METKSHVQKIVMAAMMMCLVMIATVFIRVPIPGTQGYVLGGAAAWAPWTFVIKGVMAVILGLIAMKLSERSSISRGRFIFGEAAGMVVAGIFMVAGYYLAEGVMYGNWLAPVIGIPWNIGQFVVGMVIAIVLATALCKTPARSFFTYSIRTE